MAKIKLGLKADANSACQEALLIGDYPYITSAKWWVGGDGKMLTWAKKKIQRKKIAFHNFFDKNIIGAVGLILIYFWNKIISKTYPFSQNKP